MFSEFKTYALNEQGKIQANIIAAKFSELLGYCRAAGEPGRELSLVATKLEEACFFAKKAVSAKLANQEGQ
jgi:hypothetical protein